MVSSSHSLDRWRSFKTAIAVIVALASWETQAGTLDLSGYKLSFLNIEQNPGGIYGTLTQQTNVVSNPDPTESDLLLLNPTALVVQGTNGWGMGMNNGTITFRLEANPGLALSSVDLSANGTYSLFLSYFNSETMAYAGSSMSLDLRITEVNGVGKTLPLLSFNKDNGLLLTNPDGLLLSGTAYSGPHNVNWAASFSKSVTGTGGLAALSGLSSDAFVTGISVSLTTNLYAEVNYASATSQAGSVTVGGTAQAIPVQPVPEPPTIILAGLGAVAVVANGYRRKKQRRDAEAEMPLDAMEETGAIALTA